MTEKTPQEGWLTLRLGEGDSSTDRWFCERCGAEYDRFVAHRCPTTAKPEGKP